MSPYPHHSLAQFARSDRLEPTGRLAKARRPLRVFIKSTLLKNFMHKLSQMYVLAMASLGLGVSLLVFFVGVVSVGVQTQVALANMTPQQQTAAVVLPQTTYDYSTTYTKVDAVSLIASAVEAPYSTLVDITTNFFVVLQTLDPQVAAVLLGGTTTPPMPPLPPMASSTTHGTSTMPLSAIALHCPMFRAALERGTKDATSTGDVHDLQQFLSDYYKLNKDDVVSGFFGSTTQSLVKKFQQEHNLPPVGTAGPLTRALIAQSCAGLQGNNGVRKGDDMHVGSTTDGTTMPHGDNHPPMTGSSTPHVLPPTSGSGDNHGAITTSTVTLQVNGSTGPVTLADEDSIVVSWTTTDTTLTSCQLFGALTDETGSHVMQNLPTNGSQTLLAWIPSIGSSLTRVISISCVGSSSVAKGYVVVHPAAPSKNDNSNNAGAVYEGVGEIGDGMGKLLGAYLSLFGL